MPRITRWLQLCAGAIFGAALAAMIRGALIGAEQMDSSFGWLSVLLGAVMGPSYIAVDLLGLYAGWGHPMLVLDWAAIGALLGVLIVLPSARRG
ncbi:MAG: hypothetical protein M3O62_16440 [Pseudomonadota bacterium]|nr:hypothetical protein [Pseudomonadota bacterium]